MPDGARLLNQQLFKKYCQRKLEACADNALSALATVLDCKYWLVSCHSLLREVEILLSHPQAITSVQAYAWKKLEC